MSEELKAIVEVIDSLGEEGARVFLWYLAISLIKVIIESVLLLVGLVLIIKSTIRIIVSCSGMERLRYAVSRNDDHYVNMSEAVQRTIDSKFWEKK